MADNSRDRITNFVQKRVANPLMRRNPFQTLLETTGRKSGEPRRTPSQRCEQHRVDVQRSDLAAGAREIERDPPAARADVERGPFGT